MEKCAQDLGNSTKAVSSAIAQLLGEVAQGNENYAGMWAGLGMELGAGADGESHWNQGLAVKAPFPFCLPRDCS